MAAQHFYFDIATKWSCKGRSPRTPFFESGTRSARHPRRHLEFCAEQICPWIGLAANADAAQSSHLWIAVPGLRALTSRFAASAARMRDSHPSPRPAKESYVAFSANHASEADAGPPASSTFLPAGHACPRTRSAALGLGVSQPLVASRDAGAIRSRRAHCVRRVLTRDHRSEPARREIRQHPEQRLHQAHERRQDHRGRPILPRQTSAHPRRSVGREGARQQSFFEQFQHRVADRYMAFLHPRRLGARYHQRDYRLSAGTQQWLPRRRERRCSLMEGHPPLSIDQLPDRTAQEVEFLCLRLDASGPPVSDQSNPFGKPMDRKVAATQLARSLRFLFRRKVFNNLLSAPDRTRGFEFEELISEQSRNRGCVPGE